VMAASGSSPKINLLSATPRSASRAERIWATERARSKADACESTGTYVSTSSMLRRVRRWMQLAAPLF
jgi:hypothetical protein